MTDIRYTDRRAAATVLTTELNSLANNTRVVSSVNGSSGVFDNSSTGSNPQLDMFADFELVVTFGTNPTAATLLDLYLIPTLDGTNYADDNGGSAAPNPIYYGCSFPVRAVTTAQRIIAQGVRLPPGKFKVALFNNATGQTTAASGNTVNMYAYRMQAG